MMVFSFFDNSGVIYQHYAAVGAKVNAEYTIDVLAAFDKSLKKKRPELVQREWFFHFDNAPTHTAKVIKEWLARKKYNVLPQAPYSPDLAPADFFFFPKVKDVIAGTLIEGNSVRTEWERAVNTIPTDEFRAAFDKWLERCSKCIDIGGGYVEK